MMEVTEKDDKNDHHEVELNTRVSVGDFDTILGHIGTGKWNIISFIAMSYWCMALPYHALAGAFISPSVDHTCRIPAQALAPVIVLSSNDSTVAPNATMNTTGVSFLHTDSCSYMKEDIITGRLEEVPCTEWDFDNSTFSSTVTSEFGLVCERQYLRTAYQSIYMGGVLVGAFFSGLLADRYGRLRVITISTVLFTVIAFGSAWLPSLELLLVSRFLLGTMHPASLTTGLIYVMEVVKIKWRAAAGVLVGLFWSVGTSLFGLFAYLERDWRLLQTYVSVLCLVMLPFFYFLDESPRWLTVMGRHKKALSVIHRAAKMNGKSLPPNDYLLTIMKNVQEQSASGGAKAISQNTENVARRVLNQLIVLFSSRRLLTITVCTCTGFFSVALVFFGLTLAGSALNINNPFVYVAISGLAELPANVTIYTMERFGRKMSGIASFGICAISLLLQPILPAYLNWLSITFVMIGKMAAASAFDVMFLFTSELYPTEIRSQGLCAGMMSSRAGAFLSPFIMGALMPGHPWAISVVFGLLSAVAAVSFVPLWETKNTRLPDTIVQLEAWNGIYVRASDSDATYDREAC